MIVVSLAPEQSATEPAESAALADLAGVPAEAPVVQPWDEDTLAVRFAATAVRVARLAPGEVFPVGGTVTAAAVVALQPLSPAALTYLQTVTGAITTGTTGQGARAAPRERDGHRKVTTEAEPNEPSAQVGPTGLFDDDGPGASGGSAGGAPGSAGSSRYFAIATTPLRFAFPSAFAYAPLPSSLPEGALEAAPTTRPG